MKHTLQTHVINELRNLLNINNLSQQDVAAQMDLTRQTISNYFTQRTELTLNMTERFSEVLAVPVVSLFANYGGNYASPSNVQTGDKNKAVNYNAVHSKMNVGKSDEVLKVKLDAATEKIKLLEQQIELYKKIVESK